MSETFYRAVCRAELADVRAHGVLCPGANSMEYGKNLWATLDAAMAFREQLRRLKIEPIADCIIKITFGSSVRLEWLGDNIDQCGPAYHASAEQLTLVVDIQEVEG